MKWMLWMMGAGLGFAAPVTVFESGKNGYHTFRIPAVVRGGDGEILAFAEGRKTSAADHGDIDLVLRRSTDGGKTWGDLRLVAEEGDDAKIAIGNPAPVLDRGSGVVHLLFCRNNARVFHISSKDGGRSWSERRELTQSVKRDGWGWYATGPGHGIQLEEGRNANRLVVACDYRLGGPGKDAGPNGAHALISDDGGVTWRIGAAAGSEDGVHPNETTCVELKPRDGASVVYFNTRDQGGPAKGTRGEAWSIDGGESFRGGRFVNEPEFVCPVVQGSLLRIGGRIWFSCPNDSGKRRNLSLWSSDDDAETWSEPRTIVKGPSAYSDLVELDSGGIGLISEEGDRSPYERIVFRTVK